MNKQLPERADFDHLKGQAKSLLSSLRAAEPEALARAAELGIQDYRLANAQLIIAREYGFDSWAKLKRHVEGFASRREAFFAALKAGDRNRVRELLDQDSGLVHAHDDTSFGASVITIAAGRSDQKLIDLVLEYGANIDARSTWWAGSFGALDMADEATSEYLLSRGAKLTAHAAARLGMVDELRKILSANPDVVHERGGDGQLPLHFAKTPEIVDILVDAGSDLDARDLDHCGTAAQFQIKNLPVCRRLIERGATPDIFIATALDDPAMIERVLGENPDAIHDLVGREGDPLLPAAPGMHIYVYTVGTRMRPQFLALQNHLESSLQCLLARSTPALRLLTACMTKDESEARKLQHVVGMLSESEMGTLSDAAWWHQTAAVKLMLDLGFDVDVRGTAESSAIDRAAFHGFDDTIEAILPYAPDLTIKNEFGGTPLSACIYGSLHSWRTDGNFPRSVELLIRAGAVKPERAMGSPEVNQVLATFGIPT